MNGNEDAVDGGKTTEHVSLVQLATEVLAGAAVGATAGVLAGPPGIVVGAVIGGGISAATGVVLHEARLQHDAEDEQLDRDIGVIGGNIGEALAGAPPVLGAFHPTSMGVAGVLSPVPSEGPMQNLDES